jgi:hypothetical protein
MSLNAKELLAEMKLHKYDWSVHWKKYIPTMQRYIKNHDLLQIRDIMSGGDPSIKNGLRDINIDEIHYRFEKIRTMLSIIVPNLTSMLCVTFRAAEYNYAYVYFVISSEDIKPVFFSVGENLLSADGEWRSHISDIGAYNLIEGRYALHMDTIWNGLPKHHEISNNIFYSHDISDHLMEKLNDIINEHQYGKRLFALAWFSGKYNKIQTHVAPAFLNLLSGDIPDIPKKDADDMYTLLGSVCGCIYSDPLLDTTYPTVQTGQKLILLTPDEASHPLDTSYCTWNEIITSMAVTDMVLNMISPCFAIHGAWFFIYNANKELFNLTATHTKITVSNTIRANAEDMSDNKTMSDIAIGVINENLGFTFINDIPTINVNRYIFDIIFALYCMNTKLGKIHGDLHGNNIIVTHRDREKKGYIIYAVGGVEYIFPHTGTYACIIDFSRVINTDDALMIEAILFKYDIHFPQWVKVNKNALIKQATNALNNDIEQFAKVASAFDMYEFASSILAQKIYMVEDMVTLLKKIKQITCDILMSITSAEKHDKWANMTLIDMLFTPSTNRPDAKNIYGYYSHENKLVYSISKHDTLPSMFTSAPMIADESDTPVPSCGARSMIIQTKYSLMVTAESFLREVGL